MKRLYRSTQDRMLGGVCAGLGEHLDVDPTVIRLIWVAVTILSIGVGIVVYIIAWIIVPEERDGEDTGPVQPAGPGPQN
jgi:phage shock protein C